MKTLFYTTVLIITPFVLFGQAQHDSIRIETLSKAIDDLKATNETLLNSLEITSKTLNELVRDKKVSDETKWNTIKRNINGSTQLYKALSDDIINLKSRLTDQDYQGYIKSLSSIQKGPLGFSFQNVIIESATETGLFKKKAKLERFIKITKSIINSPILSNIPFVSNAVSASNAILDIIYSASMGNKKTDLEKLHLFESELNKYLSYYTTLDKANILNQTSNGDRRVLLEHLQIDLLNKLKTDTQRLKFPINDRKRNETIDAYFNRVLSAFNTEFSHNHLTDLEAKYRNSNGDINYSQLLQKELDIKYYNNTINLLVDIAKKYILYYENFFEVADNYQHRIIEAVNLAKGNNIIKAKKDNSRELTPTQVYDEIINSLKTKKTERDNGIIHSINIPELKQKMAIVKTFKLI